MAQLSPKPITKLDIAAYLKTSDDFHFELQAHQACLQRGFQTAYGGTYADPVTNKARQFDIRATQARGVRRVHLLIECKCLKPSFPLLVSRIPRTADESYHEIIVSEDRLTVGRPAATKRQLTAGNSIYRTSEPVGKSLMQVGKTEKGEFATGDNDVWEKWSQAIASAHELVTESVRAGQKKSQIIITALIPILVVRDGCLWAANYSPDGTLQGDPQQVEELTLYVGHNHSVSMVQPGYEGRLDYRISHLHVLTLTGLNTNLDKFKEESHWGDIFPRDVVTPLLFRG